MLKITLHRRRYCLEFSFRFTSFSHRLFFVDNWNLPLFRGLNILIGGC
jgi:hypothetical protein